MTKLRTLARAGAVLATAALLVPSAPASAATAKSGNRADAVLIHVDSVTPSTPKPTTAQSRLTITLTVTNTTSTEYPDLRILGERGDPIGNQTQLDDAIANPVAPASGLPITPQAPVSLDLQPDAATSVVFSTFTSTVDHLPGICICATAEQPWIYPLFFSAHQVFNGVDNLLGITSTYLPIFYQRPQPVRVSWIWPLLEPPHRFINDTQFTDDSLAASVSTGRLSRALGVVEQVGPTTPMTLLIDPELLDELEVMSTEPYTVPTKDGKTTPGVGQPAATEWLDRLRSVLLNDPKVSVELTPYADPDVETLTERKMSWSAGLPPAMADRVTTALAGRALDSTLAWPVTGAISRPTLHRLRADGVTTAVLNADAVHVSVRPGTVSPLLVRLEGPADDPVIAPLLSPSIEKSAANAVSAGGQGAGAIPTLVAELAVRAAQQPDVEQSVTIAAPRYVDPDVASAVRAIQETSQSYFAKPIALSSVIARGSLLPNQVGQLAKVPAAATAGLPAPLVAADAVTTGPAGMKLIRSLLDTKDDSAASTLVEELPSAIQRAESSAWRDPSAIDAAGKFANLLSTEFDDLASGVQFLGTSSGSYTLASNTGPLPITISNKLPYAVRVRVIIRALQTSGFSTKPVHVQSIEANSTKTVLVTATAERAGLIKIAVLLKAPNGHPVGTARTMQVRSTALGFIGVIIMIVAGSVLGLALLWRIIRRVRSRHVPGSPPADAVRVATPEPVS